MVFWTTDKNQSSGALKQKILPKGPADKEQFKTTEFQLETRYHTDSSGTGLRMQADSKIPVVDNNIIVDRFIVVNGELKRTIQTRYKRSRHPTNPAGPKDNMDIMDVDGHYFYEPSTVLTFCKLFCNVNDGENKKKSYAQNFST